MARICEAQLTAFHPCVCRSARGHGLYRVHRIYWPLRHASLLTHAFIVGACQAVAIGPAEQLRSHGKSCEAQLTAFHPCVCRSARGHRLYRVYWDDRCSCQSRFILSCGGFARSLHVQANLVSAVPAYTSCQLLAACHHSLRPPSLLQVPLEPQVSLVSLAKVSLLSNAVFFAFVI